MGAVQTHTVKGSAGRSFCDRYTGRKLPMSSRDMPSVICVRSLVPKEKNSASAAIAPARRTARGVSIMTPTRKGISTTASATTSAAAARTVSYTHLTLPTTPYV